MSPRDYRSTHAEIATNILAYINGHPDAFDALLYMADSSVLETTAPGADVVGSIEGDERNVSYADPVSCRAVMVQDQSPLEMTSDGDIGNRSTVDPVVMMISVGSVANQSVIQYFEFQSQTDQREISLYVLKSELVGTAPGVYQKLFCLPMQNFTDIA